MHMNWNFLCDGSVTINVLSDVNQSYCYLFGDVNQKVYFSAVNKLSQ
jgi:hypothetical protein